MRVAHIIHPLRKKAQHIGIVKSGLEKRERIPCPADALVTLRAVGRYRKVIRVHSPADVGNKTIDIGITGLDCSGLDIFRDGRYRYTADPAKRYRRTDGNARIPEAEERISRTITLTPLAERITHRSGNAAQIGKIQRPFRPVVAARFIPAAFIEHFRVTHVHYRTGGAFNVEIAHGGGILPEIHNQFFAGTDVHLVSVIKKPGRPGNSVRI